MKHDIFTLQEALRQALRKSASTLGLPDCAVSLEAPKDKAHGDYSTPLALMLGKQIKRPPLEIAREIAVNLKTEEPLLETAAAAPPGFINMKLLPSAFYSALSGALALDESYGTNAQGKGLKVLLEFVSSNPTGPLNVVNARAAALGDSIANLLTSSGAEVVREYYINDAGVQARLFGESLLAACDRVQGKTRPAPEGGYQGAYMEDLAREYLQLPGDQPEPGEWGMARVIEWHRKSLLAYGVSFDRWFSEKKELHDSGYLSTTLDQIKKSGICYEKDGAVWIRVSEFGAPKDEVLLKSDGKPAYFAADIAYHLQKFERGFTKLLDIWGPDHHGHIQRMKSALAALKLPTENFIVLVAQQVNLLEGGGESEDVQAGGEIRDHGRVVGEGRERCGQVFLRHARIQQPPGF